MVSAVRIELAGEPKGKGRPRFRRATGATYTPHATRQYEAALRYTAQAAMRGRPPLDGALRVRVEACMSVPASWSKKRRAAALAGHIRPTVRPDLDNLAKALDACNGVVFGDDRQIVEAHIAKVYSDRPRLVIVCEPLG
jgi:Holliday junction resolvase RusA-like endonuclease